MSGGKRNLLSVSTGIRIDIITHARWFVQLPNQARYQTSLHPYKIFSCGQICGQENSTTNSANFQEGVIGEFADKRGLFAIFLVVVRFWDSSSQTRRPTNWATPGYSVKRNCSLWSNMWSREFYHIFSELSTAVFAGVHKVTGEYATFEVVEPIWCSSSQIQA